MENIAFLIALFTAFLFSHPQKKYIRWFNIQEIKKILIYSLFISSIFVFPWILFKNKAVVLFIQIISILFYLTAPEKIKKSFVYISLIFLVPICIKMLPHKYFGELFLFTLILAIYEFVKKNFVKKFKVSEQILGSFPAEFVCNNGEKIQFSISAMSTIITLIKEKKFIIHPFKKISEKELEIMKNAVITDLEIQIPIKFSRFIIYFSAVYLGIHILVSFW